MEIIAFGRTVSKQDHSALDEVALTLSSLPRRFKRCEVEIVMHGASSDYEAWVAVRVISDSGELEAACVEWITKQVTRQGYAIVLKAP